MASIDRNIHLWHIAGQVRTEVPIYGVTMSSFIFISGLVIAFIALGLLTQ